MVCLLNVGVIKWTVPQNRDKFKLKLILVSADINQPVAFVPSRTLLEARYLKV